MGRTLSQKKAAMSKLSKQDIDKLLEMLNAFHRYPTWTSAKRESWDGVLDFIEGFEHSRFSGDHFTYGISKIGEVCMHEIKSPSSLYRNGWRGKHLLICTGHGPRKSRIYTCICSESK